MSRRESYLDEDGTVALFVEPLLCVAGGILGGLFVGVGAVLAVGRAMNRAARRPTPTSRRKR